MVKRYAAHYPWLRDRFWTVPEQSPSWRLLGSIVAPIACMTSTKGGRRGKGQIVLESRTYIPLTKSWGCRYCSLAIYHVDSHVVCGRDMHIESSDILIEQA